MSASEAHHTAIAIVGGGCSGLLVAVQLSIAGFARSVTVIEPSEQPGAGLAYSTLFDQHLLDVPAGKISALPGQPLHFLDWFRALPWPHAVANSFAPRKLYGAYLRDLLQQTIRAGGARYFNHIRAEAIGVAAEETGARLDLSDGKTVHAERVVLALGNPASSAAWRVKTRPGGMLAPLPMGRGRAACALRRRTGSARGTGLTAVDSILALQSQETDCRVFAVSRRGFLPEVHDLRASAGVPPAFGHRGNVRLLLRELRMQIEAARRANLCWHRSWMRCVPCRTTFGRSSHWPRDSDFCAI